MELQSLETKKTKPVKWILIMFFVCILIWLVILLCAVVLLFTTGDSNQQLPDSYENNSYNFENVSEPYWLSYPNELEDFTVDKNYLESEGLELGPDFYQEVMQAEGESLLQ